MSNYSPFHLVCYRSLQVSGGFHPGLPGNLNIVADTDRTGASRQPGGNTFVLQYVCTALQHCNSLTY